MNPETAPKKSIDPEQEDQELINGAEVEQDTGDQAEQDVLDPEYSPEDTEGIARAAAGATNIIEEAVKGDRRMLTSYTDDGLRGVVEANTSDAHVRGEFSNNELKKIEITLSDDSGKELPVTVIHPESGHPRVMLDGQPVDPNRIPAVNDMIEQIKSATAEKPDEEPEETEINSTNEQKAA